jgi:dihydrofolate synthase / folylpolyglutamate synthase
VDMSYAAAVESLLMLSGELHSPAGTPRRKFRLEDMRVLMSALSDPQLQFPSILVAGTNGKGSTCSTLASILTAADYRVGLYTSPHLSRVNERIHLSGETIADSAFAERYFRVHEAAVLLVNQGKLPALPSFFETMTAIAFLTFAEENVQIAVLEVGMGGRLDATNIVEPLISVITDISLDHTEWLGPTVEAIAREKAGILRQDGVLITLSQLPEANHAIGEVATALNVRGVNAAEYIPFQPSRTWRNRYPLEVLGSVIEVDSPLAGVHQQRNIALAISAAVEIRNNNGYNISSAAIESGIRSTNWPGRLEMFPGDGQYAAVLIDVAHNPAGAWALRAALSSRIDALPSALVFGCLGDKAIGEMAQILFPLFDRVILVRVDSPRAASLDEMEAAGAPTGVPMERAKDAADAMAIALDETPADRLVVVCGSVYLVGKVRESIPGMISRKEAARSTA